MIQSVWLIPAFPLAAFLVNGLFGRRWLGHLTGWIASAAVGASAVVAIGVFLDVLRGAERTTVTLYTWIGVGDFRVNVAALIDPLSTVMLLVVTVVSTLIFIYANGYMAHDHGFHRFFTWFPLFVFAMLVLVMADNYLLMFVGWEGVGLCSYLLIGFWFDKPAPQQAANKAFWMNRVGDWGYTIGIITIFLVFGSLNFTDVFDKVGIATQANLTLICVALFVGAAGKSAQLPLHSWLPDAMEGPTPVSALIHAATMVTAGVYLVARSTPLFVAAGGALAALPPLAGFWSKDEIVGAAFLRGQIALWAVGILTAVLTAFYVTRALWLTFHGDPRDHHLYDHAHESPTVMTLPLVLLAVGSAALGLIIGFPPDGGFIHTFLDRVFEPCVPVPNILLDTCARQGEQAVVFLSLAAVSVGAGVIGILIGLSMYVRHRPDPASVARAAGPYYRVLPNKYYVDELFHHRCVDLLRRAS